MPSLELIAIKVNDDQLNLTGMAVKVGRLPKKRTSLKLMAIKDDVFKSKARAVFNSIRLTNYANNLILLITIYE